MVVRKEPPAPRDIHTVTYTASAMCSIDHSSIAFVMHETADGIHRYARSCTSTFSRGDA